VRHRLGVGGGRRVGCEIVREPATDEAEVGGEVGRAIRLARERGHDVDVRGQHALHRFEEDGVGAELEDRAGAGRARELRVERLVGVCTEAARRRDAKEDVGAAGDAIVLERGLDDHVRATAHGIEGGGGVVPVPEVDEGAALGGERLDEAPLVGFAAVAEGFEARVGSKRDGQCAFGAGAVELRQVAAGEVVGDVGGAEQKCGVVEVHRRPPPPR
jgi:hypothetical protein